MAETKATERIKTKNRKRRSKKKGKSSGEDSGASETVSAAPTGPEPRGMKEKVKRGFLTEREALKLLADSPETASPSMVGWLRRRLKR